MFLCGNPSMIEEMVELLARDGFREHTAKRRGSCTWSGTGKRGLARVAAARAQLATGSQTAGTASAAHSSEGCGRRIFRPHTDTYSTVPRLR